MKSRLYFAVICYILAVVLLFIAVPILSHRLYPKTQAVKVTHSIERGEQLTCKDIETVEIGVLELPEGIELTAEDVIGRYASVELVENDILLTSKLSQLPLDGDHPKDILPAGNVAQLVTLKMIEGSEYPIPETGDVIKLNRFRDKLIDIPELQFIRILSVLPAAEGVIEVTVSVNEEQKQYIKKHRDEVFYGSVIVRSNEELAEKLLQEQKAYFEEEK